MNITEIKRISKAIRTWEQITSREGYDYTMNGVTFEKSSLLHRLLDGKDPLPDPPPTQFSYPWYDVIEGTGPWLKNEGSFWPQTPDVAIINQSPWHIVEGKHGDDTLIVSPTFRRKNERIVRPERYRLTRVAAGFFGWTLERT